MPISFHGPCRARRTKKRGGSLSETVSGTISRRPGTPRARARSALASLPMSRDPITRRATCACGALVLVCEGEPVRRSMCHCLSCKQRTGSIFGVHARYARDKVTATGPTTEYVRVRDEGGRITHRFCPTCGTTVYWALDSIPGFFTVAV